MTAEKLRDILSASGSPSRAGESRFFLEVHVIHVSRGNSKIGHTPNISLPPGLTCQPGVPCAADCYAKKSYRQYEGTRKAWDENLAEYVKSPIGYFDQIEEYLKHHPTAFFRWHVAGDIPDLFYLDGILRIADSFPITGFLVYTRFPFEDKGIDIPDNLTIIRSLWFYDRPMDKRYPHFGVTSREFYEEMKALQDAGKPLPAGLSVCEGSCEKCRKCWNAQAGELIINKKH